MIAVATSSESPAQTYARLLRTLQALNAEGKSDTEEADAVRDQMDAQWYELTEKEQARLRALSEDLHALAEGGPQACCNVAHGNENS